MSLSAPLCVVCGSQPAAFVCQSCGRPACRNCFDPASWTCQACRVKGQEQRTGLPYVETTGLGLPSILFLLAFAAVFLGALLIAIGSMQNLGNTSGGAIILIGPIPIILGGGPYSFDLIALAVALTVVSIVVFLFVRKRL
jgi:uncharacterized membrane protein